MSPKRVSSLFAKFVDKVYICEKCGKQSAIAVHKKPVCKHCSSHKVKPKRRPI